MTDLTREQRRAGRAAFANRRSLRKRKYNNFLSNLFRAVVASAALISFVIAIIMYYELDRPSAGLDQLDWDKAIMGVVDMVIVPPVEGNRSRIAYFLRSVEGDFIRLEALGRVDPATVQGIRRLENYRIEGNKK